VHLGLLILTLSFVAVLTGVCAVVAFVHAARLRSRGVAIEGRVVGHAHDHDGRRAAAIVEYVVAGEAHRVRASALHPHADAEVGAPLSVVVVPSDPRHARVARLTDLFTPAYALGVTFAVLGGVAVVLLYAANAAR
jgi:hypothetical protein